MLLCAPLTILMQQKQESTLGMTCRRFFMLLCSTLVGHLSATRSRY